METSLGNRSDLVVEDADAKHFEVVGHDDEAFERFQRLAQGDLHDVEQPVVANALLRQDGVHALVVHGGIRLQHHVHVEERRRHRLNLRARFLNQLLARHPASFRLLPRLKRQHRPEKVVRLILQINPRPPAIDLITFLKVRAAF